MTNFYDNPDDFTARGIDYDLCACLEYNPQGAFAVEDIERVLAVWEGQNDGDDWRWILLLKDGRIVFLQGGCDYTGWDCQSSANHVFTPTAEDAAKAPDVPDRYLHNDANVREHLLNQLKTGKALTWRETHDGEMRGDE